MYGFGNLHIWQMGLSGNGYTSIRHNNACRLLAFLLRRFPGFLGCREDARGLLRVFDVASFGLLAVGPLVRRVGDLRLASHVLLPRDGFENVAGWVHLKVEGGQAALVTGFPVPDFHINEVSEHGVVYVAVIEWRIEDKRVVH